MRMSVPRFVAGAYLTGMVQLALVAFPIAVAARGLAGEIGEGTVDLLGAQPLSRGALYAANAAVIGIGAAVLGGVGFLTIHVAGRFAHTIEPLPMDRFAWVAVNAASLSICTGGIAMLCSASVSDHGRAVMGPAAAIAATAVFELMASMWDVLDGVRWVGLYFYFNPLHIADGQVHQWMAGTMAPETWAWLSSSVLLRIGAACMLAGYLVYRRRDIATI
jgi:ABC-type transport system involved in multi-copper enzyme maturation permease subunit